MRQFNQQQWQELREQVRAKGAELREAVEADPGLSLLFRTVVAALPPELQEKLCGPRS